MLDALEQRGFKQTTPIQSAVLPYVLAGKDVVGCAETGTGKTAAYVLPLLSRLLKEDREAGPRRSHHATRALILAPTRELATHIDDEIQGFAYHAPVASAPVRRRRDGAAGTRAQSGRRCSSSPRRDVCWIISAAAIAISPS